MSFSQHVSTLLCHQGYLRESQYEATSEGWNIPEASHFQVLFSWVKKIIKSIVFPLRENLGLNYCLLIYIFLGLRSKTPRNRPESPKTVQGACYTHPPTHTHTLPSQVRAEQSCQRGSLILSPRASPAPEFTPQPLTPCTAFRVRVLSKTPALGRTNTTLWPFSAKQSLGLCTHLTKHYWRARQNFQQVNTMVATKV